MARHDGSYFDLLVAHIRGVRGFVARGRMVRTTDLISIHITMKAKIVTCGFCHTKRTGKYFVTIAGKRVALCAQHYKQYKSMRT